MPRRLRDPALRDNAGQPLDPGQLREVRRLLSDELLHVAASRNVDLERVRDIGRVAQLVERRLELLAERDSTTIQRRQTIAGQTTTVFGAARLHRPG